MTAKEKASSSCSLVFCGPVLELQLRSMCPLHSVSQGVGCLLSIPQRSGKACSKFCALSGQQGDTGQQVGAARGQGLGPRSPPHHPAHLRSPTPPPPPGSCGRGKEKRKAERCRPRLEALLGLGPSYPCQTAALMAALICHFQSLPAHVMKERRMESGRRLIVEGGGNLYICEKTEEQIVEDEEKQRTH